MNHLNLLPLPLSFLFVLMASNINAQIDSEKFYKRAIDLQDAGKLTEAEAYYSEALQIDPAHTKSLFNRGLCYLQQGKLSSAENDFSNLLNIQPGDLEALEIRGNILLQKGNWEGAIEDYSKILRENEVFEVRLNRGIAYSKGNQLQKARADFETAYRKQPDNAIALRRLGDLWMQMDNITKAALYYRQSLNKVPDDIETLLNYGVILVKMGKNDEALKCFDQLNNIKPHSMAYANSALVRVHLNQTRMAEMDIIKALSLDRTNPVAHYAQGLMYMRNEEAAKAADSFDLAVYFDSTKDDYYLKRAEAYFKCGRYNEAIADCDHLLKNTSGHPKAKEIRDLCNARIASGK